jgi:hypothetical protein
MIDRFKHKTRLFFVDLLRGPLPYTEYGVGKDEYVGTYDGSIDECIHDLYEHGYHYQLFAARKTHDSYNTSDRGSYARVPFEHPSDVSNTSLEEMPSRACQYHIHPFVIDGTVELYGHYEIHPYPHIPTIDFKRPKQHYNPIYGDTYLKGVADDRLTDILEQ